MAHDETTLGDSLLPKSVHGSRGMNDHHGCNFMITFSKKLLRNHKRKIVLYGREVIFILSMYFLYQLTYLLVGKLYPEHLHREVALKNSHILIAFERAIGMFNMELSLQALFVQTINSVTLMKVINAFYLGAHLPVSLFFFFHLAYCRTISSSNNKHRKKQRNTSRNNTIQITIVSPMNGAADASSEDSSVAGNCEEDDGGRGLNRDEDDDQVAKMPSNYSEARPPITQPILFLYWVARRIAKAGNLEINSKDYKKFRWSLFLIHAMFGVTIVLLPMAPPRMLTEEGYVDTIIMYTKTELTKTEERLGVNPYAAMPSLHFSYALFVGIGYFIFAVQRWLRITGFIYTVVVGLVIVITGNHYIMDAVIALAYCYLCVVFSTKIVTYTSQRRLKITLWMEQNFEKFYIKMFGNDEDEGFVLIEADKQGEESSSGTLASSPRTRNGNARSIQDV